MRFYLFFFLLGISAMASWHALEPSEEAGRTAAIQLGQALFEDRTLSASGSMACASCHQREHAFAQNVAVPELYGERRGTRNVPSLLDLPYFESFFWDGRGTRLDLAVIAAFTNPAEMGSPDMDAVIHAISARKAYREQFRAAFGDERVDQERVSSVLMSYLASLTTAGNRYDAFVAGDTTSLSEAERRGMEVFMGKADCGSCHSATGKLAPFTDNRFHHSNVGLERMTGHVSETISAFKLRRESGSSMAELVLSDPEMAALGRFAVTSQGRDLAAYRTPTLRNISRTAPYMHDGSVATLEEAIRREIYYRSLARGAPISLTAQEQRDLRAFLQALDDAALPTH